MSFTLTQIPLRVTRSIFEAIRLCGVENDMMVDIMGFADNPTGVAAYETAVTAMKTTNGFAVSLFGAGSSRKKYEKKVPRIVIIIRNMLPGTVGGPSNIQSIASPLAQGEYQGVVYPGLSSRMLIDINLVSETNEQDIALHSLLFAALPRMGYIDFYDAEDGERFMLRCINNLDISNPTDDFIERSYLWEIPDIYEAGEKVITPSIKPIQEITVETYLGDTTSDIKDNDLIVE